MLSLIIGSALLPPIGGDMEGPVAEERDNTLTPPARAPRKLTMDGEVFDTLLAREQHRGDEHSRLLQKLVDQVEQAPTRKEWYALVAMFYMTLVVLMFFFVYLYAQASGGDAAGAVKAAQDLTHTIGVP